MKQRLAFVVRWPGETADQAIIRQIDLDPRLADAELILVFVAQNLLSK